ncbi:MAG: hypothetical protein AAGF35_02795, partial [Pseudomonadota bacterium]
MPGSLFDIQSLIPLAESGYTVLTPNSRLSRRIKSEWDKAQCAKGERVWDAIKVMPVSQWYAERWQMAVRELPIDVYAALEPLQETELWEAVIAHEQQQGDNSPLLRIDAAAALAAQARETLLSWQVDWTHQSVRQQFSLDIDCRSFLRWLERFETTRKQKALATAVDSIHALLSHSQSLPKTPLALVCFGELPPLHRLAIEALASEIKWINPRNTAKHRQYSVYANKREQLQAVSHWAAEMHHADPESRIGIVLSDMTSDRVAIEYLLRREFDCLGRSYTSVPVNF